MGDIVDKSTMNIKCVPKRDPRCVRPPVGACRTWHVKRQSIRRNNSLIAWSLEQLMTTNVLTMFESMQSGGGSRCGGDFNLAIDRAKVGMTPPKCAFEGAVQGGRTDIEERLYCPPVPTHLLLLDRW